MKKVDFNQISETERELVFILRREIIRKINNDKVQLEELAKHLSIFPSGLELVFAKDKLSIEECLRICAALEIKVAIYCPDSTSLKICDF